MIAVGGVATGVLTAAGGLLLARAKAQAILRRRPAQQEPSAPILRNRQAEDDEIVRLWEAIRDLREERDVIRADIKLLRYDVSERRSRPT